MSLTPLDAAKLADAVYGIRTTDNIAQGFLDRGVSGMGENWDLANGLVCSGSSGMMARRDTGFGVVLAGRGRYVNQTAVVIRGTATIYDGLTDANFSVDQGPNGHFVHAGFNRVFKSMIDQLNTALTGHDEPLHIVGHSLGGGIANLVAASLLSNGRRNFELYTFGCPRVGLRGFNDTLIRGLGTAKIHRVYNINDPVPKVPLYPYAHPPGTGLWVGHPGGIISPEAHYMSTYTPLVEQHGWGSLGAISTTPPVSRGIDDWLEIAARHAVIPGSGLALRAMGYALKAILRASVRILGISALVLAEFTDQLAFMIDQAVRISAELSRQVLRLLEIALRWTGRTIGQGVELTRAFLTYVLRLIILPLQVAARIAFGAL